MAYSYENYLKLKRLHAIWLKALIAGARWERWVRKAPHNRVLVRRIRNADGQKIGREIIGSAPEPKTCDLFSKKLVTVDREPIGRWFCGWIETSRTVEEEYRKAKHPKPTADDVEPAGLTGQEIDTLLTDAEGWVAS